MDDDDDEEIADEDERQQFNKQQQRVDLLLRNNEYVHRQAYRVSRLSACVARFALHSYMRKQSLVDMQLADGTARFGQGWQSPSFSLKKPHELVG
jgi:hypothetical protein